MAGDGEERAAEARRHVLDEAGLAAAGRPLQEQRQAVAMRRLEERAFVARRADRRGSCGRGASAFIAHSFRARRTGPGAMTSRRTTTWL